MFELIENFGSSTQMWLWIVIFGIMIALISKTSTSLYKNFSEMGKTPRSPISKWSLIKSGIWFSITIIFLIGLGTGYGNGKKKGSDIPAVDSSLSKTATEVPDSKEADSLKLNAQENQDPSLRMQNDSVFRKTEYEKMIKENEEELKRFIN